ncbi:MAG TPA: hypothetical protein VJ596_08435 [Gemmatimonadaceae bacterium]|nr:hypothetical protein [Gemmatimonadaceae bacterium]
MAKSPSADVKRELTRRVAGRLAGSGIARSVMEEAVDRVLDALDPVAAAGGTAQPSTILAAISARSVPDLGSRVRRDLERDGVVIEEMGLGAAGQHTVVTVRVSASARAALQRLAERSHYSLSFLNHPDTPA